MTETRTFYSRCFLRVACVTSISSLTFQKWPGDDTAEHTLRSPASCIAIVVRIFDFCLFVNLTQARVI